MSDLIDRQVLREDIEKIYKYDCQTFVVHYAQVIDDLPSTDPERKWIPVTEALPEEDEEVLVTVHFDGTKDVKPSTYVETASQISGSWFSYSDDWNASRNRYHVIAWMPLPEPWRGEEWSG